MADLYNLNNGLLTGLAQGVKGGLEAFRSERDRADKLRQQEIENEYKKGLLEQRLADRGARLENAKALALFKNELEGGNAGLLKNLQTKKMLADFNKSQEEQTPRGKLDKMGGDVKQKVGFITGGLKSLTSYEDAFRGGGRQSYINSSTPLLGSVISSTPIDERRTELEEAIGRLASGGAINTAEENRFRKMIPTAADSDESAARKLLQLRSEFENKLIAYGFKPDQLGALGFDPKERGYGDDYGSMPQRGLIKAKSNPLETDAVASEGGGLSPEKKARLDELRRKAGK